MVPDETVVKLATLLLRLSLSPPLRGLAGDGRGEGTPVQARWDSIELDEVLRRQRAARKLHEAASDCERTEIDTEESEARNQRRDLRLRLCVIA